MDVLKVLGADVRPMRERKPPWFKVPPPGGPKLPRAERADQGREPAHGLPGGRLPERRRVLGARHRDVHDPRRHLHPPLRLLQRQDRQADVERPARARARRALGRAAWACATRSSRASTATTCPTTARAPSSASIRQIRRQAPDCKVEVLTPDFRGQEMPLAKVIAERPDVFNHNVEVVPRLYPVARRGSTLAALAARAAQRQGDGRRRGRHEVGPDGRPRRDARRDGRGVRRRCASTASRSSPSASTCARPSATCRSCATGTRTSSRRSRTRPTRSASTTSPPARSCARATTPTSTSRRTARRRARCAGGRRVASARVFPLKDNIPTERFPVVTVVLIALNVIAYFFLQPKGGIDFGDGSLDQRGPRPLRRDPVRAHALGPALRPRAQPGRSRARASRASRRRRRPAADLADRRSPRCSCTAGCCTSAATCCSCGSSATTSRTRWARCGSSLFYLLGGLAATGAADRHRPGRDGPERRRLGRDRRRPRRLHPALSRARGSSRSCSSSSSSRSSSCPALFFLGIWFVQQAAVRLLRPATRPAAAAASPTSPTSAASCSGCSLIKLFADDAAAAPARAAALAGLLMRDADPRRRAGLHRRAARAPDHPRR